MGAKVKHVTGHWLLGLQQGQTLESFLGSGQRHLCDRCKVQLLRLHHQSHTHWVKTSHFQLSKEDSADSSEYTVAVKKTYNFRASYQDQMSPSRDLQKFSSRHLKKHLQLREGMKIITTPLLLMSTGASLNLHALSARASPTILSELVFFCCL